MKLSAGEAFAAGGLLVIAVQMLDQTGPGFGKTLHADTGDEAVRAHLTAAEMATATTLVFAALTAAVLMRAAWPLVVGLVAIALALAVHEGALRIAPEG